MLDCICRDLRVSHGNLNSSAASREWHNSFVYSAFYTREVGPLRIVFYLAPKLARKCESKHWFPCGVDGRSYGHVITEFSWMGRLPHFLSYGAPSTRGREARAWSTAMSCSMSSVSDIKLIRTDFCIWKIYYKTSYVQYLQYLQEINKQIATYKLKKGLRKLE